MREFDVLIASIIVLSSGNRVSNIKFSAELIEKSVEILNKKFPEEFKSDFSEKFSQEVKSNYNITALTNETLEPILTPDELQFMKEIF